jgi:hypothetical protein
MVIHHDSGGALVDASLFHEIDDLYLTVGDDAIAWGDMTLEAARWRMYLWILDHLEVDWVVLLSEQDYAHPPPWPSCANGWRRPMWTHLSEASGWTRLRIHARGGNGNDASSTNTGGPCPAWRCPRGSRLPGVFVAPSGGTGFISP